MVDDDVLGPDGGEAVAAEVPDALGEARPVGRELEVRDGRFTDDFSGEEAYGREWGGVEGDNFCYMPNREEHDFRELITVLPSGYGYNYNEGKACVRVYEIPLR